jgi:hypothetical protein
MKELNCRETRLFILHRPYDRIFLQRLSIEQNAQNSQNGWKNATPKNYRNTFRCEDNCTLSFKIADTLQGWRCLRTILCTFQVRDFLVFFFPPHTLSHLCLWLKICIRRTTAVRKAGVQNAQTIARILPPPNPVRKGSWSPLRTKKVTYKYIFLRSRKKVHLFSFKGVVS